MLGSGWPRRSVLQGRRLLHLLAVLHIPQRLNVTTSTQLLPTICLAFPNWEGDDLLYIALSGYIGDKVIRGHTSVLIMVTFWPALPAGALRCDRGPTWWAWFIHGEVRLDRLAGPMKQTETSSPSDLGWSPLSRLSLCSPRSPTPHGPPSP
ncbi:hypothetical protein F4808DRAFT_417214, partial [Astrocystis sublimbata]